MSPQIGMTGEILAAPVYNKEAILTARIDLDAIKGAKFDLDTSGHYARPDVFKLAVVTEPQIKS